MAELDPRRCCKSVWNRVTGWPRSSQCQRKGVVERNGKLYCKQHDPEAAKARREEADDRWRAQIAVERDRVRRRDAEASACKGIPTEALEAGVITALFELREAVGEMILRGPMYGDDRLVAAKGQVDERLGRGTLSSERKEG